MIDKDETGLLRAHQPGNFLDLALAEECRRTNRSDRDDSGARYIEVDRARKPDCFLQP
jgi:hypothetical protein